MLKSVVIVMRAAQGDRPVDEGKRAERRSQSWPGGGTQGPAGKGTPNPRGSRLRR